MKDGASSHDSQMFDCRVAFADELTHLARENEKIVAVCNDSVGSSNLGAFQKEFPDRLINVGIAEQNMIGVSAGLSNGGFIPFVCAATPFLTGRALEQIKADIAYSGYPVVLCGMSPGLAYGELGPTHHSVEDLPWLRAIAGLTLIVPADPTQTRDAVRWAATANVPVFLRIGRTKVPEVTPRGMPLRVGQADQLRDGSDVTVIATGVMVARALAAAEALAKIGIKARIINMSTVQPIDKETIIRAARETGRIVTVEEAVVRGGLGSAVAEVVVQEHPVPMRLLGVTDFAPTGNVEFLLDYFKLNSDGIVGAAIDLMRR